MFSGFDPPIWFYPIFLFLFWPSLIADSLGLSRDITTATMYLWWIFILAALVKLLFRFVKQMMK